MRRLTAHTVHLTRQPSLRQTPYRLAARNSTRAGIQRWRPGKKRTKPPGTSASLAFPCERADHLEVSCSERYRQSCSSSNDCGKANFGQMWTTVWKRCAPLPAGLWTKRAISPNLRVGCVETCWASGLTYFVWLFMSQSQGLIQILRRGRLSPTVHVSS